MAQPNDDSPQQNHPNVNDDSPATVVIAGAGITGLVLALALHKEVGVTAEVYEKLPHIPDHVGVGVGMYANGLRVIRDLDPALLHTMRDAGYPFLHRRWERHDGTEIMQAEENVLSHNEEELSSFGIRRHDLLQIVYDAVVAAGIPVHFSKGIQDITTLEQPGDDDLIQITFEDGTKRQTQILFGSDGMQSKVRFAVMDDPPPFRYMGVTCLMGSAPVDPTNQDQHGGICFPCSPASNCHAVFFPTSSTEQYFEFYFHVDEADANKLRSTVGPEECQTLAQQLRTEGWHERFLAPLHNAACAVRMRYCLLERPITRWFRGRVVLVGDAAHPPVPYIGQGTQMGLEDAGVLASLLKMFCVDHTNTTNTNQLNLKHFTKAMELYESIRGKRAQQVQELSQAVGDEEDLRCVKDGRVVDTNEMLIKGEVLMHGTLPDIMPGADHDYKEDIRLAVEVKPKETISPEKCLAALEDLMGLNMSNSNMNSSSNNILLSPTSKVLRWNRKTVKVSPEQALKALESLEGLMG